MDGNIVSKGFPMLMAILFALPFCPAERFYQNHLETNETVVMPSWVMPEKFGGWMPTPVGPQSNRFLEELNNKGMAMLGYSVHNETFVIHPNISTIGKCWLWEITYRVDVSTAEGEQIFYVDHSAIIRFPKSKKEVKK